MQQQAFTCSAGTHVANTAVPVYLVAVFQLVLYLLQTYNNYLHIYGIHTCKTSVLQGAGLAGLQDLKHVDIYLQHSIAVQSTAAATSLVGDSRSILLGLSDGTCQVFSWQSKV